jgi:hypothetical protein
VDRWGLDSKRGQVHLSTILEARATFKRRAISKEEMTCMGKWAEKL